PGASGEERLGRHTTRWTACRERADRRACTRGDDAATETRLIALPRGEVWLADLDPTRGHEQAGRRPVLIVSDDVFNAGAAELVVVLPMTSTLRPIAS